MLKLPSYLAMRVPLLDLGQQYRVLSKQIREAIDDVLDSHRFILGSKVQEFESAICRYRDVPHAADLSGDFGRSAAIRRKCDR
jgi:hypothetical protein